MANTFRGLLKNHKQATLAGQYGQFEHAFNFLPPADSKFKIGPGESITFDGKLTTGGKVQLVATNDLTGPSGQGFQAQETSSPNGVIVVGDDPSTGQATLTFTLPTALAAAAATTFILSFHSQFERFGDEWFAIDENDNEIFRKAGGGSGVGCLHRSASPDDAWYSSGRDPFSIGLNKWDLSAPLGSKVWADGFASAEAIAYDPSNDTVMYFINGVLEARDGATGLVSKWSTNFGDNFFQMVADESGFLYGVMRSQNDRRVAGFPGNKSAPQSVFKIDTATGEVVASFNTNVPFNTSFIMQPTIARDPNSGELFVCEPKAETAHDGTGAFAGVLANVYKFDSNLVLLATAVVTPVFSGTGGPPYQRDCTVDENGDLYIVDSSGRGKKLTGSGSGPNSLPVVWSRTLCGPLDGVIPGRHSKRGTFRGPGGALTNDQNGTLFLGAGQNARWNNGGSTPGPTGGGFNLGRYRTSDGGFISGYANFRSLPTGTGSLTDETRCLQLRLPAGTPPPGGTGEKFTTELSQNPPGNVQAFAAVKYDAENVSAIYFNSVNCEFDPGEWKATHSAAGPISFDGQWTYNTSL